MGDVPLYVSPFAERFRDVFGSHVEWQVQGMPKLAYVRAIRRQERT